MSVRSNVLSLGGRAAVETSSASLAEVMSATINYQRGGWPTCLQPQGMTGLAEVACPLPARVGHRALQGFFA